MMYFRHLILYILSKGFFNISSTDLASAKPGIYTATLRYRYRWDRTGTDPEGNFALTLTVPTNITLADDTLSAQYI